MAAPILLVLLRLLQGIAIGGEWGGAVLMSVEYAPPGRRSLFGSVPQMGLAIGLTLGTGVFALLGALMDDAAFDSWGWRVSFWISIVLVVVGLIIRLKVVETPAFRALAEAETRSSMPAKEMLADRVTRRTLLLGMGARWVEGVAFNTWAVFSISYATDTLGMDRTPILLGVMGAALCLLVLIPVAGLLGDRHSPRLVYAVGCVLAVVAAFIAFPLFATEHHLLGVLAVVIALGVLYPVMYGPESSFFAGLFPVGTRYTGISAVYQFSGIFASGLTPLVLTWLLDRGDGGTRFILAYFVLTGVVSLVCTLAIRRHDQFEEDEVLTEVR